MASFPRRSAISARRGESQLVSSDVTTVAYSVVTGRGVDNPGAERLHPSNHLRGRVSGQDSNRLHSPWCQGRGEKISSTNTGLVVHENNVEIYIA